MMHYATKREKFDSIQSLICATTKAENIILSKGKEHLFQILCTKVPE